VVPWAVNQVYWRARPIYDRLMQSGEQLRQAQVAALQGKNANLRSATDAHRAAIADAVRHAERFAAADGSRPPSDALMRTLEALSLAAGVDEAPGRLTRALQPAGFEALAGVKIAPAPSKGAPEAHARVSPAQKRAAERAAKKEEAAQKKRDAEVRKAEAAVERARRRMREAEEALKRSRAQTS
jgi:hypothetical protein